VLAQRTQFLAHQGTTLQRANAHQPDPAVREVQHLQGSGITDQTRHVFGDQLFGADPHIDRDAAFAEQPFTLGVIAERTRAIFFGVRYKVHAIWQASMLTSSLLESATRMSVDAMPAASRTRGLAALPLTVRMSRRSCSSRSVSSF